MFLRNVSLSLDYTALHPEHPTLQNHNHGDLKSKTLHEFFLICTTHQRFFKVFYFLYPENLQNQMSKVHGAGRKFWEMSNLFSSALET
jgi:hypothetical protein